MIFLVLEGDYTITNPQEEAKIFGCKSITSSSNDIIYNFELTFSSNGKIVWTSKEDILTMFKCTYEESIQKMISIEKSMEEREGQLISLKNECEKYELTDF